MGAPAPVTLSPQEPLCGLQAPPQHHRCPRPSPVVADSRHRATSGKAEAEARPVVRWEGSPWLQAALGSNPSPSCGSPSCHLQLGLRCLIHEGAKVSPSRVWRVSAQQGPAHSRCPISAPPSLISTVMGLAPLHSECQGREDGTPRGRRQNWGSWGATAECGGRGYDARRRSVSASRQ